MRERVSDDLPADQLVVPIDSGIFDGCPGAAFHVSVVAVPGAVLEPDEFEGCMRFRANVYIDEKQLLPAGYRRADGGERDLDDKRSVHFGVAENMGGALSPRIVGASRLILKSVLDSGPLPVERHFPEAFSEPLPTGVVEASRFIARHPERPIQQAISLANIRAMVMHAAAIGAPGIYAIVEESLALYLKSLGLPLTELLGLTKIEEYDNTENMAVVFDPTEIIRFTEDRANERTLLARFFRDAGVNRGLGHYDRS